MGATHSHKSTPPRATWKWEYGPNLFASYPPEASVIIERHFLSGFSGTFQVEIPNSPPLTIDLNQFVQTCSSSKRRLIREINEDVHINALWSWENDLGEMEPYSTSISTTLETHYRKKGVKFTHLKIEGSDYWIDFANQYQISMRSMRKRRIERNVIPDHKFIWQWQADSGEFVNYLESISRKIETDYFLNLDFPQSVTLSGQRYYIDTKRMCEINETDGKERQIRRVLESYVRHKWYWKDDELDVWRPFSSCLIDKFEANYLDPTAGPFSIIIDYTAYEIDIKAMTEKDVLSGKTYPLKRQPLPNDFAVWGWTTKPGVFKTFPPSASKLIENHYVLNDPTPLNIEVQDKKYCINIRRRVKLNTATQKLKVLERRIVSNNYPPNLEFLSKVECQKIFKFLSQYGYLPQDWECSQREELQRFGASDTEWSLMSEKFFKTMDPQEWLISNLYRFQNIMLINMFLLNKMSLRICHRSLEEPELLFYIPNKEKKIDLLDNTVENPLEGHFSPLNNFGKGYYFTKSVEACKDYAWEGEDGTRTVMCFWVLPGKTVNIKEEENVSTLYNGKYNTWDEVRRAPTGADCSRVTVNHEEILVVYNAERCYPLYIIEFQKVSE